MTTAQEQFNGAIRDGQNMLTQSVQAWQDAVQNVTSTMVHNVQKFGVPSVPGPQVNSADVDNVFNVADQLLSIQREYAKTVLESSIPAVEAWTKSAQQATEAFQNAVQDSAKAMQNVSAKK